MNSFNNSKIETVVSKYDLIFDKLKLINISYTDIYLI